MDLHSALELGKACGLKTVGESLLNIELHCMSLFLYSEIDSELKELSDEFNASELTKESSNE